MLTVASPGDLLVHRVARRSTGVFVPADWRFADPEDGTFGGRFDDPRGRYGIPPENRFRSIYCATSKVAALAETLAPLRPSLRLRQDILDTTDDDEDVEHVLDGTHDPADPSRGLITSDWRNLRQIGSARLDRSMQFADVTTAESFRELSEVVAPLLSRLGIPRIDLSSITGEQRLLTQECARYIYELDGEDGEPLFAGIRYISHLDGNWECWAIFDDRMRHHDEFSELSIFPDNPDLCEAARLLGLSIETFNGAFIRP